MKFIKKLISVAVAASLTVTGLTSLSVSAAAPSETAGTYTGNATYIDTYFKYDYFGSSAFEISYKYTKLATNETITEDDGTTRPIDYTDTFEFLVFDQNWGGWEKTKVGQASPVVGEEYTETVSIADIESKLSTGADIQGINLQTGGINDAQVEITSLKYVEGSVASQEVTIDGRWVKGTGGMMTVSDSGGAYVSTTEWYILVSQFSVNEFENPTVDVTVEYETAPNSYVQSELQKIDGTQILVNYPYVSSTGEVTYTTEIPSDLTAFLACYDDCVVKRIRIYDNTSGNVINSVTGKTAAEVADDMGMAWNLGNSFDCVDNNGNVGEVVWGNPVTTKNLIQTVKAQEFNTIRIPVSYMNMINYDNTVNDDYLARIKQVVDYAYDMGMYVVIDIHNDGGNGITGKWLDITKTGAEFAEIRAKFAAVWTDIAAYFKDYDQKLVFEGFNELMNSSYSSAPTHTQFENINILNQTFVDAVRSAGGKNNDRVLIVAGYNTNIQYTIARFTKPVDTSVNRLMLSVHCYDPFDFTLNEMGTDFWSNSANGIALQNTINSISEFASDLGMPVFIGEYGAIDKNNTAARSEYYYWINYYAASSAYTPIVLAYWDNGVVGVNGHALFDRTTNTVTSTGLTLVSFIKAGYNQTPVIF